MIRFEYPPKPTLISKDQPLFTKLSNDPNVVAERKYNGTRVVVMWYADGRFEIWERHRHILKYEPSIEFKAQLSILNWKGDCVIDAELMHFKTDNVKHTLYVYDVFYWDGQSMKNETFKERRRILEEELFKDCREFTNIILAPQFKDDFQHHYEIGILNKEIEGLVMKRLDAKLIWGYSSSPVVSYMWKVRKPDGKYKF